MASIVLATLNMQGGAGSLGEKWPDVLLTFAPPASAKDGRRIDVLCVQEGGEGPDVAGKRNVDLTEDLLVKKGGGGATYSLWVVNSERESERYDLRRKVKDPLYVFVDEWGMRCNQVIVSRYKPVKLVGIANETIEDFRPLIGMTIDVEGNKLSIYSHHASAKGGGDAFAYVKTACELAEVTEIPWVVAGDFNREASAMRGKIETELEARAEYLRVEPPPFATKVGPRVGTKVSTIDYLVRGHPGGRLAALSDLISPYQPCGSDHLGASYVLPL